MPEIHTLEGLAGRAYLACSERGRTAGGVATLLDAPESEVAPVLEDLAARRLALRDGSAYLSLAIPASRPRVVERAGRVFFSSSSA